MSRERSVNGMAMVVLVDDEDDMHVLLGEWLKKGGHEIFAEASSMEDAKSIVARCVAENIIPIFVIDGAFPVQGQGAELALIIRKEIPGAKIISCSGDPQNWGDVNLRKGSNVSQELPRVVSSLSSGQV